MHLMEHRLQAAKQEEPDSRTWQTKKEDAVVGDDHPSYPPAESTSAVKTPFI